MPVKLDDHCGLDEGLEIAALNDGLGESAPGHPCLLQSFNNRVFKWRQHNLVVPFRCSPCAISTKCKSRKIELLGGISVDCGGVGDLDWQDERRPALFALAPSDHKPHQSSSTSVIAVDAARTKHTNVDKNQTDVMIGLVNNLLLLRRTVVSVFPTSHSMLDWDSKDSSRSRHTVAVLHLTSSQLHCVEGG